MDEAKASRIAVMRALDAADAGGFVARGLDLGDALAERAVLVDRSGVAVPERERGVSGRRAQRVREPRRKRALRLARAAAIDDQPLRALAELEGEGRGAAAGERPRRRLRSPSSRVPEGVSPLTASGPRR